MPSAKGSEFRTKPCAVREAREHLGIEAVKEQKVEKPREKWKNRLRLQIAGSQKNDPLPECSAEKKTYPQTTYIQICRLWDNRKKTLHLHFTCSFDPKGGGLWGRM